MSEYQAVYKNVCEELAAGRRAVVVTRLRRDAKGCGAPVKSIVREPVPESGEGADGAERKLARRALEEGRLQYAEDKQGSTWLAEPYFPASRLIILGGGHIAKPLAEFGAKCGFSVTVADDRPEFANKGRFPAADQVICESFDRCFERLPVNRSAFVVIITRGHRHDMDCLRRVLGFETAYTGMIGSRRRVRAAMEQLASEGFPRERLEAVRAPIGLDIGAETPEEIAVSILSEVIRYKRKLGHAHWPAPDREVLEELCESREDGRALVTIVETKGSVPREAGAKMVVWPYGKILGSIGGGCSESAVMQTAYDVIQNGRYTIVHVDMTGEVAEEEGMVCGGTMKVLIEPYGGA
jgi:xanthine dehydrogenase accessory factor